MNIQNLVRENIRRLTPYSSARDEFAGEARIFLDANENSFGSPLPKDYNRYPDPLQSKIREKMAEMKGVRPSQIFVGNGSDEAIDLLMRIFCRPGRDNIIICPPTYGMYKVSAGINDVAVKDAPLTGDFRLDRSAVRRATGDRSKILFICSPNNPTGNAFPVGEITALAESFPGIVVVDEAYIHFSSVGSMIDRIEELSNLVVLQTFSKAWGLAGLRVGLAFASEEMIELFNKVKPPYNVSGIAQEAVLQALENRERSERTIAEILRERDQLFKDLSELGIVERVYPTDANFVLVKTTDAGAIYRFLLAEGIVVRDRQRVELCAGCLRITVGTPEENESLLGALGRFETGDR
ncbi:MAG: histidinol-phosphate transaminase [Pyrinomonadaceae bacterium]